MAYLISCYIVKETDTNLTPELLREEEFSVFRTSTGYLLMSDHEENSALKNPKHDQKNPFDYKKRDQKLRKMINDHKKKDKTFVYFYSDYDMVNIKVYGTDEMFVEYETSGWNERSYCYTKMKEALETKGNDIFNDVGLGTVRYNEDFLTIEQKEKVIKFKEDEELEKYNEWKEVFEKLTEKERFQRFIKIINSSKPTFGMPSYSDDNRYRDEKDNIVKYYNLDV